MKFSGPLLAAMVLSFALSADPAPDLSRVLLTNRVVPPAREGRDAIVIPCCYVPSDGNSYLEMQVHPDPVMAPRVRIVSAAYAYLAGVADSAAVAGTHLRAGAASGVGLWADAYNNASTDTAIYARGRGIATGDWGLNSVTAPMCQRGGGREYYD